MKVVHQTLPDNRVRLGLTAERLAQVSSTAAPSPLPPTELFTVWVEDAAHRAERRFSELLSDCIAFRLDRYVADAHEIPPMHRHGMHAAAYESAAAMVHLLTGVHGRAGFDQYTAAVKEGTTTLLFLDGLTSYPLHFARKRERNGIARMWHVLQARLATDHAPSCHTCLLPTTGCTCAAKEARA